MKTYPIFYRDEMVVEISGHKSQSTWKPKLFTNALYSDKRFTRASFKPVEQADFALAHTDMYVQDFFTGGPDASSSDFPWTEQYAESVRYTTGSLYSAIKWSVDNKSLSIAPVSGFHHATPDAGQDFCAMSGQAIASLKLYKEYGLSGAYIDLDAHYGNSIDDTYKFNKELYKAIPRGLNVNPTPIESAYEMSLIKSLKRIRKMLDAGTLHYVVLCHGADSCLGDDTEGILPESKWIRMGELVAKYCQGYPLVYTLFGGYRRDDYKSVIDLHMKSLDAVVGTYSASTP